MKFCTRICHTVVFVHTKFGLVRMQGSRVKRGRNPPPQSERVFQIPVQIGLRYGSFMLAQKITIGLLSKLALSHSQGKSRKDCLIRGVQDSVCQETQPVYFTLEPQKILKSEFRGGQTMSGAFCLSSLITHRDRQSRNLSRWSANLWPYI